MSGEAGRLLINYMIRKARQTPPSIDPLTGARVARYPAVSRWIGWALFALTVTGGTLLSYKVPERMRLGTLIGAGVLLSLLVAMLVDFTLVALTWTDHLVVFTSPWRGARRLRWEDVTEVEFAPVAGWFIVRSRDAGTIRPAMMLGGLEEFFAELATRGRPFLRPQIEAALELRAQRCD